MKAPVLLTTEQIASLLALVDEKQRRVRATKPANSARLKVLYSCLGAELEELQVLLKGELIGRLAQLEPRAEGSRHGG